MPETNSVSSNFAVNGFSGGGNSDTPAFSIQDELKKKDLFSVAAQHPNLNLQSSNASIW